jgi:DNA transformation protein and related proteins
MAVSPGFAALVRELLDPLGPVTIKSMFGGAGIYVGGAFMGLIDDDVLYFKTDEASRAAFATEGMGPFSYETKKGTGMLTSYWRVPDRLHDEPDEFQDWARTALAVARRGAEAKSKAPGRKPPKRAPVASRKRGRSDE